MSKLECVQYYSSRIPFAWYWHSLVESSAALLPQRLLNLRGNGPQRLLCRNPLFSTPSDSVENTQAFPQEYKSFWKAMVFDASSLLLLYDGVQLERNARPLGACCVRAPSPTWASASRPRARAARCRCSRCRKCAVARRPRPAGTAGRKVVVQYWVVEASEVIQFAEWIEHPRSAEENPQSARICPKQSWRPSRIHSKRF